MRLWIARIRLWVLAKFTAGEATAAACPDCGKLDLVAPPRFGLFGKPERLVRVWSGPGLVEQTMGRRYYCARCGTSFCVSKTGAIIERSMKGQPAGPTGPGRAPVRKGPAQWTPPQT